MCRDSIHLVSVSQSCMVALLDISVGIIVSVPVPEPVSNSSNWVNEYSSEVRVQLQVYSCNCCGTVWGKFTTKTFGMYMIIITAKYM